EKSKLVVIRSEPRQRVATQFKTLTPVGMAIKTLAAATKALKVSPSPDVNMWWAQTRKLRKAIATLDPAMKAKPKIGLREKTGIVSEIIPKAGKMTMYTSG